MKVLEGIASELVHHKSAEDGHMTYLETVASGDVAALIKAEKNYGGSWKKRGGCGAFMMLARKWDRLEKQVEHHSFDIFEAVRKDLRAEGLIDDIRDLRRYLTLVEAELMAQNVVRHEVQKD